jgi:hypothetical protein
MSASNLSTWPGRSIMIAAALAFSLVGMSAASAKAPAYVGKWASKVSRCKLPEDTLDAPVVMTKRAYNQFETHCDFLSVKRLGGAWHAPVSCQVEGSIEKDKLTIWASSKALSLKWGIAKGRLNYVRCK